MFHPASPPFLPRLFLRVDLSLTSLLPAHGTLCLECPHVTVGNTTSSQGGGGSSVQ